MSRRTRAVLASLVVLLALAGASGCTTLPTSGAIHRASADAPDSPQDAPYVSPPGPAKDGSPAAIVSGFLVAMTANPLSTSVARTFLTERARAAWEPNRATIVYDARTVDANAEGARLRLADTHRLDSRGGWRGGSPGRTETLDLRLVPEKGQWRIDNPVNALIVPSSFFDLSFARFNLYFYDQTGRVLMPDPIFIPRGEQTATNLVRGLLAGPGSTLAEVTRSALPSRTDLDNTSVVVTESGVAEVPLTREVLRAPPGELSRAVDQLAWTLRQVPGIERVRITVNDAPVPLSGGRIDAPVTSGDEFDAAGPPGAELWGLRGGRVVDLQTPSGDAPEGPFSRTGYSMRSFAVSEAPRRVAAVSGDGSTLFVASGNGSAATPAARALRGSDLLRPSYDMFGDLWVIDKTSHGARVYVLRGNVVRQVQVPGVTGADVAAFSVARDGSRLAVAYAGSRAPDIRVTDILRTDEGIVSGAGQSRTFSAGDRDATRLVDIGWRDPSTLAVLSRSANETSQVTYVSADGSPVAPELTDPNLFRGAAQAMVVSPDTTLPLLLVTPDQRLYTLGSNGNWPRTSSKVVAATYVR